MYIIHVEFLQWINEKCNQIKVQPFLAGNLIQTHWPRHFQAYCFSIISFLIITKQTFVGVYFVVLVVIWHRLDVNLSTLYYNRQYIFSIILFNNLFFATSFHYYFVNVDIPMRNLVMEQKCFGQMASFKWSIADT